jgi:hypothetical protein
MKKKLSLYLALLMLTGLWSCKSEDPVFEQSADERLNQALDSYQKELSGAPYGWKGVIYPGAGGGYSFYFKFNDKNRVVMYSDFDMESATTAKESSYRLKALQAPSLIFDTYSYLHVLADPDGGINGGDYGEGLKSDFEFAFRADTLNTGTITLIGTKNSTRLLLTKATQEESIAYESGGLGKSLLFSNIAKYQTYFKRMTIGGVTYDVNVDLKTRKITLTWMEGTTVKTFTTDYYYGSTGVSFIRPLVNGAVTINGLTNLTWDANKLLLGFTAGGSAVTLAEAARPLSIDQAAPRRWWQFVLAKDSYWISLTGFTVAGKEDFFGVTKIPNFYYMLFFPSIASSGGQVYDAFTAYDGNSLMGPAVVPTFTTDGRVSFSVLGTYGDNTLMNTTVLKQVEDPSGYYLVQTSDLTYDMVSAKDGKTWITWWYPF